MTIMFNYVSFLFLCITNQGCDYTLHDSDTFINVQINVVN